MLRGTVQVPSTLLLARNLSASAKLVWMGLRLYSSGQWRPSEVAAYCGLASATVKRGLLELETADWYQEGCAVIPVRPTLPEILKYGHAEVPAELVGDHRVRAQGRVLYGVVQLLPTFQRRQGEFTYRELCDLTHLSVNTVKRAIWELVDAGWLSMTQQHQHAHIYFRLTTGRSTADAIEIPRIRRRLHVGPKGEAIMREWLTFLVPLTEYLDNARPGNLTNPLTGQPLELDRSYAVGVAFEYNGEQHERASERFSEEEVTQQQGRDLIKQGLCVLLGIKLVIVKAEDLSLDGMRKKIGDLLPIRDLTGHERLIAFLESESEEYRESIRRRRQGELSGPG